MEEDDSDDDNLAVLREFVVFCVFVFKRYLSSSFVVVVFFFACGNETIFE